MSKEMDIDETLRVERVASAVLDFDAFVRGYVEAALRADFMPEPTEDNPEPEFGGANEDYDVSDLSTASYWWARERCARFVVANADDLGRYCERVDTSSDGDAPAAYAGHDFWLTSRGHGCGFWDRGLGEVGERLTKACEPFDDEPFDDEPFDDAGSSHLPYATPDGVLHFDGAE